MKVRKVTAKGNASPAFKKYLDGKITYRFAHRKSRYSSKPKT